MSLLLLFGGAVPTGVAGSSATTNAADTSTATGKVTITGSSATTNAADTSTASGSITITGASATTNANDVGTGTGDSGAPAPTADGTHTGLRPRRLRQPQQQLPIILSPIFGQGHCIGNFDVSSSGGLVDPHNVFLEDEELLLLV